MKEWLKKVLDQIKGIWSKWKTTQKIIFFGIVGAVLLGLILLIAFSSAPSRVPLINMAITDATAFDKILARLEEENVEYTTTASNLIYVKDKKTAARMKAVLIREDLVPSTVDPWAIFDVERWTTTDFERNVNVRRAVTASLIQHIEALEDVDDAKVTVVMPETSLFAEVQNPVTASIILTAKPGSDIATNRKKIEGIQKLVMFAIEGLEEENITITDNRGITLNDFEGMADFDRVELAKKEVKLKNELEAKYKNSIIQGLSSIYSTDRVRVINVDVTLDFSKSSTQSETYEPIVMKPDNPKTPFDEREYQASITISKETTSEKYEGTGFNPEGPAGSEGQTAPAYQDLSNLVGSYSKESVAQNEVVNSKITTEEKSSYVLTKITASVAIDGIWNKKYNDRGVVALNPDGSIQRTYVPVPAEELAIASSLVQGAIGYDKERGDLVTVQHLQFDRSSTFQTEDAKFRSQNQLKLALFYGLIGLGVVVLAFVLFRLVSRELERKRRLREEELARQHQAMREAALRAAEDEGVQVEMSVEERARLEMQENAINMAREHPEDVAQLIRTWLTEE